VSTFHAFQLDFREISQKWSYWCWIQARSTIEARFSAGVWSCASSGVLIFFPLPRFAGVTSTWYLLCGAKTPIANMPAKNHAGLFVTIFIALTIFKGCFFIWAQGYQS
jgi:hypothetical protein